MEVQSHRQVRDTVIDHQARQLSKDITGFISQTAQDYTLTRYA